MSAVDELDAVEVHEEDDLYALRIALDAAATQLCAARPLANLPNRATAELDDLLAAIGEDDLAGLATALYELSRLSAYAGGGTAAVAKAQTLLSDLREGLEQLEARSR